MISSYDGTVRVVSTADKLPATIALDHGELTISSGSHEIGRWLLDDLRVTRRKENDFHIEVEGDELAVSVNDPTAFATAVGLDRSRPKHQEKRRRFRRSSDRTEPSVKARPRRQEPATEPKRSGPGLWARFKALPLRWKLVIVIAPLLIALGIIDLFTLASLLVLSGVAILVYSVFALSDDPTVYVPRAGVPEWVFPVSGVALVVIGIGLMMLT